MHDARTRWTLLGVILLVFLGTGVGLLASRRSAPAPIVITPPNSTVTQPPPVINTSSPSEAATTPAPAVETPAPKPAPEPMYYVHVAGAVKRPSLYLLSPGSRVMQAIKAAGGPTAKADLDSVNLAEKIKDGEKVYVPVKVAAAPMLSPPGNAIGHQSIVPDAAPSTPAPTQPSAKTAKSTKAAAGKPAKLSSPSQGQVNINTASAEQLQRLPGIGPAMAARVIAYRQQAGGFKQLEDLQEVGGIGPKKYAKMAPLIKLK